MDVFVLGGVVLVLTVVVYILATLGTKETPFEEALAEQRQREQVTTSAPVKVEKQFKKPRWPKKPKVKKDSEPDPPSKTAVVAPVVVEEHEPEPEPEAEPEPEREPTPPAAPPVVTEPQPSPQPPQEKRKEKKKKKEKEEKKSKDVEKEEKKSKDVEKEEKKSKDVEKEEKKSKDVEKEEKKSKDVEKEEKKSKDVEAEAAVPRKLPVVEKVEEIIVTKAEAVKSETKKPEAAPEPSPPPQAKEPKKEAEAPVKRPQIEIIETVESQVIQSPPVSSGKVTPTQEKKEKKKKEKGEKGPSTVVQNEPKLVSMVQRSALGGNEIQMLIDVLLNKQQQNNEGGEWVEKGARVDPTTQLRKQLEEVEIRLKDKDEAQFTLTAKITDLRTELNGERSRAGKLKTQLDDTVATHTRQQETAASTAEAAQAAKLKELRKELEQEYKSKIEQQQSALEQLKGAVNHESEIALLRDNLSDAEMQAAVKRKQNEEMNRAYEEHIRKFEEKIASEEVDKNAQLAELHTQLANSDAARAQALAESTALAAEREALSVQLTSDNAKYAQTQHKLQESLREKTEVDSRLNQVDSELSSVRQVVLDQANQIERLKEEKESLASQSVRPAAEGQENGDVHAEQNVASDTTQHLESLVKEKEILIEQHVSEVKNLNKEISRLKEDLEGQRAKNNDTYVSIDKERAKVRAVLKRISPDVTVDDTLEQDAFLNAFESKALQVSTQTPQPEPVIVEKIVEVEKVVEKEVKVMVEDPALKCKVEELTKENSELKTQVAELEKTIPKVDDTKRINELEEDVKTVTEKVAHYQKVLADTEALLKSLQASVESEEVTWNKKLTEKEQNVRQLTADKANLEMQIKQLETMLEKVRQAEEMDSQLKVLQEQLQKEEKEKASLLEELQNAQEQLTKTAAQGGSDQESAQELRTENEKLRTLVTVGQDASREQDQLIEQLQQELATVKSASTNGPASEEQCQEGAHIIAGAE